jgi:hypothetical protein
MLELESGKVSHTFNCSAVTADMEDIKDDPVTALVVSDDEFGSYLFTSYRSGLIIKWSREGKFFTQKEQCRHSFEIVTSSHIW